MVNSKLQSIWKYAFGNHCVYDVAMYKSSPQTALIAFFELIFTDTSFCEVYMDEVFIISQSGIMNK